MGGEVMTEIVEDRLEQIKRHYLKWANTKPPETLLDGAIVSHLKYLIEEVDFLRMRLRERERS